MAKSKSGFLNLKAGFAEFFFFLCRRKRHNNIKLFKVFRVIPSNVPVSRTLLRAFTTSQTTRQRKSLLNEAGILSSQKPKQNNSYGKKTFYFRKKVYFFKFSHLNLNLSLLLSDIREMRACTRGQLTWLDCFEQKYLSIYISFLGN